jgi:hypothetical protein
VVEGARLEIEPARDQQRTPRRIIAMRVNALAPKSVLPCIFVSDDIRAGFEGHLTQF